MLVGMGTGFVVGLLPGIGGAASLALMLPFVFTMTPVEAFAFLLGMHSVAATTGDITSILFGVPGEGLSAATVVDGHPMAKRGEAGRALGAALMSSLAGRSHRGRDPRGVRPDRPPARADVRVSGAVHGLGRGPRLYHLAQRAGRARPASGLRDGALRSPAVDDRAGAAVGSAAVRHGPHHSLGRPRSHPGPGGDLRDPGAGRPGGAQDHDRGRPAPGGASGGRPGGRQGHLPPLLAGRTLLGDRRLRRDPPRGRRRRRPVDGLCPRRPERPRREGAAGLR